MSGTVERHVPDLAGLIGTAPDRTNAAQLYTRYRAVYEQIATATRNVEAPVPSEPGVTALAGRSQAAMLRIEWMFEQMMRDYAAAPECFPDDERAHLDEMTGFFRSIYRHLTKEELRHLSLLPKSRVCQVGAGPMPLSLALYHRMTGARVVGIDYEPVAVEQARAFLAGLSTTGTGVDVVLADGAEFDFSEFDLVLIAATAVPKDKILARILATNHNPDLQVVNRDTCGWNALIYRPNPLPRTDELVLAWTATAQPITSLGYRRQTHMEGGDARGA